MVRRRSTVRFRKGAPGQRQDSKDQNKLVGPTGFTFARVSSRDRPTPRSSCPLESVDISCLSRPRSSQFAVVYLTTELRRDRCPEQPRRHRWAVFRLSRRPLSNGSNRPLSLELTASFAPGSVPSPPSPSGLTQPSVQEQRLGRPLRYTPLTSVNVLRGMLPGRV
jgi:hypothetical protein